MSETLSNETISPGAAARATSPYLFRVFQSDQPLATPSRHSLEGVSEVILGRGASCVVRDGGRLTILVDDPRMSAGHAQIRNVAGRWLIQDTDSHNGTLVAGTAVRSAVLGDGHWIECGRTFFRFRESLRSVGAGALDSEPGGPTPELRTLLPEFANNLDSFAKYASTMVTFVLIGETGVGKEVAAYALHTLSGRRGEYVAINCASLSPTLVESELFGHRRGAFTGADSDKIGLIRSANGGTLFLDEIGDLPHPVQAMLLRPLQERSVMPVGEARTIRVDFRLVIAGQRSLDELVEEGKIRSDLQGRIDGQRLRIPPLRDRAEDLGFLIGSLLRRWAPAPEKVSFTRAATRALLGYNFPRNVRELEKAIRAALEYAEGSKIGEEHLPDAMCTFDEEPQPRNGAPSIAIAPATLSEQDVELRARLILLWDKHNGNISAIAREMGKERNQIRRWLKRFRIGPYAPGAGG